MMFFELGEGELSISDMNRIAHQVLEHKYVLEHITPEQYQDLAYIVTQSVAMHPDKLAIRMRWQHLLDNFSITDNHGKVMRFYQDSQSHRLYFGDEEGWQAAKQFEDIEQHPEHAHHLRNL